MTIPAAYKDTMDWYMMGGLDGDGDAQGATFSGSRLKVSTITHGHDYIHKGLGFNAHYTNTTAGTDDHRTCIGLLVPNSATTPHVVVTITASHPAEFFLYEAPTIDLDAGTVAVHVYYMILA